MRKERHDALSEDGQAVRQGERRPVKRARKRILVRYGTSVLDKTAFTKNVSETGLFLHTNQVFRPGTTLHLQLDVTGRIFFLMGRVAWAKKVPPQLAHVLDCGMGICFVNPSPEWLAFAKNFNF